MYADVSNRWSDLTRLALERLAVRQNGMQRHAMPVGIIGPREATQAQLDAARMVGYALAKNGMALLCGGKGGVMAAAAQGGREAGGIVIGLLPEDHATAANAFLSVALPTGMGITRNALIAHASLCLVAVGGGLGTLSEMALGLQLGKRVFSIASAPQVSGAEQCEDVDQLLVCIAQHLIQVA